MKRVLAFTFVAGVFLTSCGWFGHQGDDERSLGLGDPGAFLMSADMEPSMGFEQTDEFDVRWFLRDEDQFYAHKKSSSPNNGQDPEGGPLQAFFQCYLDKMNSIQISAGGEYVVVRGQIDLSDCVRQLINSSAENPGQNNSVKFQVAEYEETWRYNIYIRCFGKDLSAYDGKSIKDIGGKAKSTTQICDAGMETLDNFETKKKSKLEYTYEKAAGEIVSESSEDESREISAMMNLEGKPCVARVENGIESYEAGCQKVKRKMTIVARENGKESKNAGKEDYEKLVFNGIKKPLDINSFWYSDGQIDFRKNNWTGSVTYSEADKTPKYTATNGVDKDSGDFPSSSAKKNNMLDVKKHIDAMLSRNLNVMLSVSEASNLN